MSSRRHTRIPIFFELSLTAKLSYSFAVVPDNRHWEASNDNRYGVLRQESDQEINDGMVSFRFRMVDVRTGRFSNVDLLTGDYPYLSPYSFCANRVIDGSDLERLEWAPYDLQANRLDISLTDYENSVCFYIREGHTTSINDQNETIISPALVTVSSGEVTEVCEIDGNMNQELVQYSTENHEPIVESFDLMYKYLEYSGAPENGELSLRSYYGEKVGERIDGYWARETDSNGNNYASERLYEANNLRTRTLQTMTRGDVGFSMDLLPDPVWDTILERYREYLRIHPDGQQQGNWNVYVGTDGCIGLQCTPEECQDFFNRIDEYFDAETNSISVDIDYEE